MKRITAKFDNDIVHKLSDGIPLSVNFKIADKNNFYLDKWEVNVFSKKEVNYLTSYFNSEIKYTDSLHNGTYLYLNDKVDYPRQRIKEEFINLSSNGALYKLKRKPTEANVYVTPFNINEIELSFEFVKINIVKDLKSGQLTIFSENADLSNFKKRYEAYVIIAESITDSTIINSISEDIVSMNLDYKEVNHITEDTLYNIFLPKAFCKEENFKEILAYIKNNKLDLAAAMLTSYNFEHCDYWLCRIKHYISTTNDYATKRSKLTKTVSKWNYILNKSSNVLLKRWYDRADMYADITLYKFCTYLDSIDFKILPKEQLQELHSIASKLMYSETFNSDVVKEKDYVFDKYNVLLFLQPK
jgi:hypothetical protein